MRELNSAIRRNCEDPTGWSGELASERARNAQNDLALAMMQVSYPAKHFVFCENEPSLGVFVVLTGGVELSIRSGNGQHHPIHVARRGEILGLGAALYGKPNEVTAKTIEETRIATIRLHEFLGFVMHYPDIWNALANELNTELTVVPELSSAMKSLPLAS